MTSMGVMSDGSYGITPGVIYSQPVTIKDGKITVVTDLNIDEFSRQKMNATSEELVRKMGRWSCASDFSFSVCLYVCLHVSL